MMKQWLTTTLNNERFALLGALAFSLFLVTYSISDFDMYWHLANGREMLNTGRIINDEVFSFTHFGQKFDNHEWLSQIVMYLIWLYSGFYGLLGFKLLVTAFVVAVLYRTIRISTIQPAFAAVICGFAILAGFFRYTERPELFSLLNTALISFILYGFRANQIRRHLLWLIPIILVVWDWLHGAIYGLLLLTLFVAGENAKYRLPFLQKYQQPIPQTNLKYLNLCFALSVSAMLLNPLGVLTYKHFFVLASGGSGSEKILELMPVTWEMDKPYILLFSWAALLGLRHIRKLDITQLLIMVSFGFAALRYNRVTGIAGIVLAPIIASMISAGMQKTKSKIESKLHTASVIIFLIFIISYSYYIKVLNKASGLAFDYQVNEQLYPAGSVRFIKAVGLTGNLYNPGEFGGYLSFYLTPERKIFQYNFPIVFGDAYRYASHPDELEKWNINYAIASDDSELISLFPSQSWARIYREANATLVVKRSPQNQPIINQYEINYFFPARPDYSLRSTMQNQATLPRFAFEMGVYLAFRKDERIANLWAEILADWPLLRKHPRIQELLKQALIYNNTIKLAQQAD